MDIGKSFGFVFEDEKWITKVLIGGLVSLIPIVDFAALGYAVRTLKNVAEGAERPLPDWGEFGDFFVKGLMVFLAVLIYSIPAILLSTMGAVITAVASSGSQDTVSGALAVCTAAISCVAVLYSLIVALWAPAAAVDYAMSGEFVAFFRFGEIWSLISANLGGYIVALVVAWLASLVASLVGAILCLVGTLFTSFWAVLVASHLLGQWRRQAPKAVPPAVTPTPLPS